MAHFPTNRMDFFFCTKITFTPWYWKLGNKVWRDCFSWQHEKSDNWPFFPFFFFKQKTAYEIMPSLVGSEMCIRDSGYTAWLAFGNQIRGTICRIDTSWFQREAKHFGFETSRNLFFESWGTKIGTIALHGNVEKFCLLYTSPSPRD